VPQTSAGVCGGGGEGGGEEEGYDIHGNPAASLTASMHFREGWSADVNGLQAAASNLSRKASLGH
jgi:hypothetical protein